jgi:putative mRNA 3-end processing factor
MPTGQGFSLPSGTGAERVFVTHGSVAVMVRWLTERPGRAKVFKTEYGNGDDQPAITEVADAPADAAAA